MAGFSDGRIAAIIGGKRVMGVYPFPGTTVGDDVSIAIRTLTEGELDGCRVAAQVRVRDQAKQRGWEAVSFVEMDPSVLDRAVEREVIWRSTFDPETRDADEPSRFFESSEKVTGLDSVTTTMLASLYLEHQEWTNPLIHLTPESVEELVERLGKTPAPEVLLRGYEQSTLRRFVISLAWRLRTMTSPIGKSDTG